MKKIFKVIAKVVVGCLALVGAAAIIMATLFLNSWPSMHWPDIQNSQILRTDCATLLEKHEANVIPEVQWPQSIQILKPKAVQTYGNCVIITISGGGIGSGWGFVVYPNQALISSERQTGMQIWGTGQQGIFKFQTIK
jgi:hypothetical protein